MKWRTAPPPAVASAFRHYLKRYAPDFLGWGFAAAVLTFAVAALLAKIFLSGAVLKGQALENGQRVYIEVATGSVEGNARHTHKEEILPEAARQNAAAPTLSPESLAPAPLASISAQTDKGLVPMTGKDGTLPWKYYARPFGQPVKRPIVALVLTDLGLSKPLTEDALRLPRNFTLSFSPYAGDARKWAASARESGFETLVDLPMQSLDYAKNGIDSGPYGLMEGISSDQNSARLRWVLSRFAGYVGVLAPENEGLTANIPVIRPTLTELAGHGVLFLYLKTPKNESLADLARAHQYYALGIDKAVDDDIAPGPIGGQLDALTALAKTQGYAVGFAHAYPPTLAALQRWVDGLEAQGVDLAPVSAVALKALQ